MKPDINNILNKLLSYAFDNLLLDTLDETYALNRLATACGIKAPVRDENVEYGDAEFGELLNELKAAVPTVDIATIESILFPMPRTIGMYFNDALDRNAKKAFDFLFDLYAHGNDIVSTSAAVGKDGFSAYSAGNVAELAAVTLPDCGGAAYVPRVVGNRIATLDIPDDIMTDDVLAREHAFVTAYGGVIATRVGDGKYYTAESFALASAAIKTDLTTGSVKTAILNYPVPALAFNGIAKNAVAREAARVIKAATDADLKPILAAAAKDGVTYYVVFANDVAPDGLLVGSNVLTACGVFETIDCSPLMSVLEKGTALSTDLAAFKPIYDVIGGVKHGAKAADALGGYLVDKFKPALAAAASATDDTVAALVNQDK